MVEGRRRPPLAFEPLSRTWVSGGIFRKELERDHPPQTGVFGLIDNAHAASTQLLVNAVVRDSLLVHGRTNPRGYAARFPMPE